MPGEAWRAGRLSVDIGGRGGLVQGSEQDSGWPLLSWGVFYGTRSSSSSTRRARQKDPCHGPHVWRPFAGPPAVLLPMSEGSRCPPGATPAPSRAHPGGLAPDSVVCTSLAPAPIPGAVFRAPPGQAGRAGQAWVLLAGRARKGPAGGWYSPEARVAQRHEECLRRHSPARQD